MKIVSLKPLILITLLFAFACPQPKPEDKDQPAQTFNTGEVVQAVAYGLGSNGGYTLKNEKEYKKPMIVDKLAATKSPYEGELPKFNSIDEIPSISNYYDGENKLNTIKVQCKFVTNRTDCLHQAGCGWCGEKNSCVTGNQLGPTEPCLGSTFIFTTGSLRNDVVMKENVGPLALTVVDHQSR